MKPLIVFGLLPFLCLAETKQERGRRVIDDALAALGGDRFLSMTDRVETGRAYSFYNDRLRGMAKAKMYTQYRPAKSDESGVAERQNFGPKEEYGYLYAGKDGWEITFRGVRPLPEDQVSRHHELERYTILTILHNRLKEPGLIFESQGLAIVDNQPMEVVDVVDADNRTVTVYFHQSTKLPVKQVYYRRDPKTKERIEEVARFAKYRDVGGVQWPFHILRERDGGKVYELFSESVTINQNLSASLFAPPSGAKVLPRESD